MQQITAGIDAGGSLIKIVYQENGRMHFKKFSINKMDSAISWLKAVAPSLRVSIAGGKAMAIQNKYFQDSMLIPEFQATCDGARFLLAKENIRVSKKTI